jgi:hypothetical protein
METEMDPVTWFDIVGFLNVVFYLDLSRFPQGAIDLGKPIKNDAHELTP